MPRSATACRADGTTNELSEFRYSFGPIRALDGYTLAASGACGCAVGGFQSTGMTLLPVRQMRAIPLALLVVLGGSARADDVLFEDTFKDALSPKWQVVGLDKKDYRIKDGGLEMRVQNGVFKKDPPMLKIVLPFKASDTATASVRVTPLDGFTADGERAGLYLMADGSRDFSAEKKRVNGKLVFSPGKQTFKGKKGEEGDRSKYDVTYTDAAEEAGLLRIIVEQGRHGYFQVGPSAKKEYTTFFYSAVEDEAKERGFCLAAGGAPDKADHWVRFTNFKVVKH